MGVILQAEVFFPVVGKDPRGPGGRISVPAPVDPGTADEPWWFDRIASRAAHYRQAGFTHILLPSVCKTQSGNKPSGTGFGLFDHYDLGSKDQMGSVETRFGSRERLQRCIAIAHANGLNVLEDMVLHQMAGGPAGVYRYKGAPGTSATQAGRFPKNPGCFRSGKPEQLIPPWRPQDPVPAPSDDYPFGDEACYANCLPPGYMGDGVKAWADWLCRSLDFDGFRVDDTKGLNVDFLSGFLNQGEMKSRWLFNEFFDGNPDTLQWYCHQQMNGRMSQLDFSAHWAIKDVLDYGHGMWRWLPQQIYAGRDPSRSVPFVDSPDTDLSPGQQVINSKLLGYAVILLAWEGLPMVYWRDYSTDAGCYGLQPHIDNMVWCHEHLVGGQTAVRHVDQDVIALERLGHQVGKPGSLAVISQDPWNKREVYCATAFGPNVHIHDYTGMAEAQGLPGDVWTDGNGWARTRVPSNEFGAGNSYTCWGPAGVADGARPVQRPTTQTFFGAADLDIAPARNGKQDIGRIWCGAGSDIRGSLSAPVLNLSSMSLLISNSKGLLSEIVIGSTGIVFPEGSELRIPSDGWISFAVSSADLPPDGVPFELKVTYQGAQGV